MKGFIAGIGLIGLALATPAWATDPHLPPGYSVDPSATANATAISGASATAIGGGANVTNVNTNVNAPSFKNENYQGQGQGQVQGQHQKQTQNNNQQIAPSQSVSVDASTNFDRYAPSLAAPALTSAGTGACLGSFSGGLVGPMAGAMFGKTYESERCENRMGSALLWQYAGTPGPLQQAFRNASLRVLTGESLKDALKAEGLLPGATASVSAPKPAAEEGDVKVQESKMIDNRGPAIQPTALQTKLEQMQGM